MAGRRVIHEANIIPVIRAVSKGKNHHDSLVFALPFHGGKSCVDRTPEVTEVPLLPEAVVLRTGLRTGLTRARCVPAPGWRDLRVWQCEYVPRDLGTWRSQGPNASKNQRNRHKCD